jgi:hypothetical protein
MPNHSVVATIADAPKLEDVLEIPFGEEEDSLLPGARFLTSVARKLLDRRLTLMLIVVEELIPD